MRLAPHPALFPLAALYAGAIATRNALYNRELLTVNSTTVPVICVGNVIAGGSGKTPFVHALVGELKQLGLPPAILLRGYGGELEGPHLVDAQDSAKTVGDEAVLHFNAEREVPIVVAQNRYAGARLIEAQQLAEVIVMDDGYQHRSLARGTNLLLLDITDEESIARWGNGRLLPAGWLREPLAAALKRANGVVLIDKGLPSTASLREQHAKRLLPSTFKPIVYQLRPHHLRDIVTGAIQTVDKMVGREITAVTAIAHPGSFFSMLAAAGYTDLAKHAFPDHYQFSANDVARFFSSESPVVVTEKDETKLRALVRQPGKMFSLVLRGEFSADGSRSELIRLLT